MSCCALDPCDTSTHLSSTLVTLEGVRLKSSLLGVIGTIRMTLELATRRSARARAHPANRRSNLHLWAWVGFDGLGGAVRSSRPFRGRPPLPQQRCLWVRLTELRMTGVQGRRLVRLVESRAAAAYWSAWQGFAIRFGPKNADRIPEHWRRYSTRTSPIARGPRVAVDPLNAALNLLFALGEFEARLALLTVGLDPGLGFAHADQPSRDPAALDLLEAIRPKVEAYAIVTFSSRTFARRDFIERTSS